MKDFIKFIGDNPIFLISGIVVFILIVILVLLIITLSAQVKLEKISKEKETVKQDIPISESEIFEDLNIEAEENISETIQLDMQSEQSTSEVVEQPESDIAPLQVIFEDTSSDTSAVETLETVDNNLLITPE